MRTSASFELFPDAPSEREIVRARWLVREGRLADAEEMYRGILASSPDLMAGWAECFELLRSHDRPEDALRLAEGALGHFGETAFALALQGAALIDLRRYPDALSALERAIEQDPNLGLAWHELGYAAYRLGDRNRALLALDRAFALEPHTETIELRGRILRDAGRYQAAEVAFEAATQTAEHAEQRAQAEREVLATRRYAFYSPRKPDELSPAERWFAETGAVVLAPDAGPVPPSDEALVQAFLEVAGDSGWRFGQLIVVGPPLAVWNGLAEGLKAKLTGSDQFNPAASPLVVGLRPVPSDPTWTELTARVAEGAGLVFVLEHAGEAVTHGADVTGVLTDDGQRRALMPNTAHALSEAQHPAARFVGRRLRPVSPLSF